MEILTPGPISKNHSEETRKIPVLHQPVHLCSTSSILRIKEKKERTIREQRINERVLPDLDRHHQYNAWVSYLEDEQYNCERGGHTH